MKHLNNFVLGIPRLYIKQYPYAWFPAIVLWTLPPSASILFLAIIVIGIFMAQWQFEAWTWSMREKYAGADGKFYVDRPTVPLGRAVRNIIFLIVGSGLIAFILQGRLGLSFWHFFLILVLFMLTYQDVRFFGTPSIYIITATGIAVYFATDHMDYRLFFTFKEISRIERTQFQKDKGWDFFARTRDVGTEGLLFIPKDVNGFSKRLEKLFIVPQDIEKFRKQLPYGFGE